MQQEPNQLLGIELGSSKTVLALANDKSIEIVLSDASQREFPNIIGFKGKERFIGEAG
jgi:heat shock protein 4